MIVVRPPIWLFSRNRIAREWDRKMSEKQKWLKTLADVTALRQASADTGNARDLHKAYQAFRNFDTSALATFISSLPDEPVQTGKLPDLYVILQGGVVQEIVSDQPGAISLFGLRVIDYDVGSADDEELGEVEQSNGSVARALVSDYAIGRATIGFVRDADERIEAAHIKSGG